MTMFWVVMILMLLLAIAGVLWPLFFRADPERLKASAMMLALYRDELKKLKEQVRAQDLSAHEYEEACLELKRSLLVEAQDQPQGMRYDGNASRYWGVAFGAVFVIIAGALYWHWGAYRPLSQALLMQHQAAAIQAEIAQTGSPQKLIQELQQRLREQPKSARGWYLLGRLYLSTQQYPEAVDAFAKANRYQPQEPAILLAYAEADFFAHDRRLTPKAQQFLQEVLARDPNNMNALNLLAVSAYVEERYQDALNYWQKILFQLPPDSQEAKAVQQMIAEVQQKIAQKTSAAPSAVKAVAVKVRVSFAPSVRKQVKAGDTVFIYALAVDGPAAPLAVVRKQVKDFPATITLTDQDAMLANVSLANYSQVKIVARVSLQGSPLPQAGDYEGVSAAMNPKQQRKIVSVVIRNKISEESAGG